MKEKQRKGSLQTEKKKDCACVAGKYLWSCHGTRPLAQDTV